MRVLIAAAAMLALSACVSSPVKVGDYTRSIEVDEPEIGVVTKRAVGETLVTKGKRTIGPALELVSETVFNKGEGEKSIMTCAVTAQPGIFFKRGTYTRDPKGVDCYGPVTYRLTTSDGTTNWNCPGQMAMGDICTDGDSYFLALLAAKAPLKQDFDNIRLGDRSTPGKANFVQELVYNGRSGNSIRLLYREFSDDLIRPAFSQDLQYDLGESSEIGFRALRMEVLEANNTSITFKVLRGFAPAE